MPRSSIVAVGSELLSGFTVDTNSNWLAGRLFERGYPLRLVTTVGDVEEDIIAAVKEHLSLESVSRVFVCGGLGPTPDDRTYGAIARALSRGLVYQRDVGAQMQDRMFNLRVAARRKTAELNAGNRRMATVPDGATLLRNGAGMAPALAIELDQDRFLFALPGVPHEMRSIVTELVEPLYLRGGVRPEVRELRYRLAPESAFFEAMKALEAEFPDVTLGSYPQTSLGELVVRASGSDRQRVEAVINEVRNRVSQYQPLA